MKKGEEGMWHCGFVVKEALFLCVFLSLFTLPHAFKRSLCFERTNLGSGYQNHQEKTRMVAYDGPGSYPPRCTGKCGDCTPCVPVHVPVPPGRPVITEYYPEAWRCKCGNKLYLP
ncbi:hypothetical protein LUZ63_018039 [Rhynchospora breviuscula]|uniref:Epidermal patterning factor-like protein n=1 Tax=Rhynchospora breviuscula TaxID=2022672 RepID=A0A9Q0C3L1_9POAL|nr:hypothetical protein LUZ63_018039 [Rhynchospora breviuscula]